MTSVVFQGARRRAVLFSFLTALTMAIASLTASPAWAATLEIDYASNDEADGMRVAAHWRLGDGSRRGLCISTHGTGQIPSPPGTNVGAFLACDKDVPEGKVIEIRAGRCDGDKSSCTKVEQYQNWSDWDSTDTDA